VLLQLSAGEAHRRHWDALSVRVRGAHGAHEDLCDNLVLRPQIQAGLAALPLRAVTLEVVLCHTMRVLGDVFFPSTRCGNARSRKK
jgi:hypothetical protein